MRGLSTLIDHVGILSQELGGADKLLTRFHGTVKYSRDDLRHLAGSSFNETRWKSAAFNKN